MQQNTHQLMSYLPVKHMSIDLLRVNLTKKNHQNQNKLLSNNIIRNSLAYKVPSCKLKHNLTFVSYFYSVLSYSVSQTPSNAPTWIHN